MSRCIVRAYKRVCVCTAIHTDLLGPAIRISRTRKRTDQGTKPTSSNEARRLTSSYRQYKISSQLSVISTGYRSFGTCPQVSLLGASTRTNYRQHKISLDLAGANKFTVLTNKTGAVYNSMCIIYIKMCDQVAIQFIFKHQV